MAEENQIFMLNLGCGKHAHKAWVNIDHSFEAALKGIWFLKPFVRKPNPAGYLHHDLRTGIPFPDKSVDVAYSSHVMEHLERKDSLSFMREIYRVLKPGGIIRIVVPDLENLVSSYLQALDDFRRTPHDCKKIEHFEWATIALLDQMVRTTPGGEMVHWLRAHRNTPKVGNMTGVLREIACSEDAYASGNGIVSCVIHWLRRINFAHSGEVHRWMYDEVSLGLLFSEVGFRDVRRVSHMESRIPEWECYRLDSDVDSSPYQPNSIWMEGSR